MQEQVSAAGAFARGVTSLNESIREVAIQGQNLQQYVDKAEKNVATLEKVLVQLPVELDLVNGKILPLQKISGDKEVVVEGQQRKILEQKEPKSVLDKENEDLRNPLSVT